MYFANWGRVKGLLEVCASDTRTWVILKKCNIFLRRLEMLADDQATLGTWMHGFFSNHKSNVGPEVRGTSLEKLQAESFSYCHSRSFHIAYLWKSILFPCWSNQAYRDPSIMQRTGQLRLKRRSTTTKTTKNSTKAHFVPFVLSPRQDRFNC